jgi:hypothetical protein
MWDRVTAELDVGAFVLLATPYITYTNPDSLLVDDISKRVA